MTDQPDEKGKQALTSQDAINVGKDVAKTTIVWTLAGVLTDAIRKAIKNLGK
jgi:hypothetical protein